MGLMSTIIFRDFNRMVVTVLDIITRTYNAVPIRSVRDSVLRLPIPYLHVSIVSMLNVDRFHAKPAAAGGYRVG